MKPKLTVVEINFLQEFARSLRDNVDPIVLSDRLSWLLEAYQIINFELGSGALIWRARKCKNEQDFESINDLIYPPKQHTKNGRVNEAGEPMLYGALNKDAALVEIHAKDGDYVQVVAFRIKESSSVQCCVVGEMDRVRRTGKAATSEELSINLLRILNTVPRETAMSMVYADAFLSSLLKDRNAKQTDYMYSRTLAQLILKKMPHLDAIWYLSVEMEDAVNIALKPASADKLLDVAGISVVKIDKRFDYGIFNLSVVRDARNLTQDRQIIWK